MRGRSEWIVGKPFGQELLGPCPALYIHCAPVQIETDGKPRCGALVGSVDIVDVHAAVLTRQREPVVDIRLVRRLCWRKLHRAGPGSAVGADAVQR
ncbi:hypothetical protein G6F58_013511 [Rhizopus delemar]|nr:hypothetical protein G6F58_013511 [Rhizopus delemar]